MPAHQYLHIEEEPMETRLSAAKDHDTSPDILKQLSEDRFWFVRDYVAANPNTPDVCLVNLLCDVDFRVREEARRNLSRRNLEQGTHSSLAKRIQAASVRTFEQSKINDQPDIER